MTDHKHQWEAFDHFDWQPAPESDRADEIAEVRHDGLWCRSCGKRIDDPDLIVTDVEGLARALHETDCFINSFVGYDQHTLAAAGDYSCVAHARAILVTLRDAETEAASDL